MAYNWDRAAKADYVRRHGAEPFWTGLARGDADERRLVHKEADLLYRLASSVDLVAEFAALTPFERRNRYELYLARLCRRFDDERWKINSADRSLSEAVDEYERGTLALLKGVLEGSEPTSAATRLMYARTRVTVDVASVGWIDALGAVRRLGSPMHVVTAWNPGQMRPTLEENRLANSILRAELNLLTSAVCDALGSAPDGSHVEESFAVVGLDRDAALAIGRRFGQAAIFELTAMMQTVVSCDGEWHQTRALVDPGSGRTERFLTSRGELIVSDDNAEIRVSRRA